MTNLLLLLQRVLGAGGRPSHRALLARLQRGRVIKRLRESGGGGEDLRR